MVEVSAFHFLEAVNNAPSTTQEHFLLPPIGAVGDVELLTEMLSSISRELDGDGSLVVWKPMFGNPEMLVSAGACSSKTEFFQEVLEATYSAVRERAKGARTYWRQLENARVSSVLVAAFSVDNGTFYVSVFFDRSERVTRSRTGETVARISPFVHPFFKSWAARAALETKADGLIEAVDGTGVGVVLLNSEGRVLFANAIAESLFEVGDGLRCRGEMLRSSSLADTLKLSSAIDQAVSPRSGRSKELQPVMVRLERTTGHPLILSVSPTKSRAKSYEAAAAIIFVVDPRRDLRPLLAPVCRLYDMSPTEVRLACELAMGESLADAAQTLKVREITARSYLKQLFSKTGTHRQIDLVRLLVGGAVGTVASHSPSQ